MIHLVVYLLCFVVWSPFVVADNHASGSAVSYHTQIVPILKRSCQGCHHPGDPNGDLIVTTYADLKRGGMAGEAIIPGKPDNSLLIELISGDEPAMPQNQEPLSAEEVKMFRRWILEGAHDDTPAEVDDMGEGEYPTYTVPPVVTAVAYSPDGSTLAVSGFREVLLYNTANFELKARLVGKAHRIESLTYTTGGKVLGVAGGSPAQFGEVQLWDTEANTLIKAMRSSYDTVYGLSFSPDASRVAFGCSDKTVRVLSVEDEKELIKFDNHSDWVFGTIFSTDGTHFVSCGRDTALKLVEVDTGSFVDDINSSNKGYGEINTIARHPTEDQVLSAGEDRIPRLYKIFREIRRDVGNTDFNLIQAYEAQSGTIEGVAFSADGSRFATGSAGGEARIYNVEDGKRLASMQGDAVGVFAVSFHPDGTQLATGGFDGKIRIFDTASGKLLNAFMSVPIEPAGSEDVALVVTGMT
jgi:WD40 repeat protein